MIKIYEKEFFNFIMMVFSFCVIFGIFLIYDTKNLIGRNIKRLKINDYVVGGIYLFLNIFTIVITTITMIYFLKDVFKKTKKIQKSINAQL